MKDSKNSLVVFCFLLILNFNAFDITISSFYLKNHSSQKLQNENKQNAIRTVKENNNINANKNKKTSLLKSSDTSKKSTITSVIKSNVDSQDQKTVNTNKDLLLNAFNIQGISNSVYDDTNQTGILFQINPKESVVMTGLKINVCNNVKKPIKLYYIKHPIQRVFEKMSYTLNLANWNLVVNKEFNLKNYISNKIFSDRIELFSGNSYSFLITEFTGSQNDDDISTDNNEDGVVTNAYITLKQLIKTTNYSKDFNNKSLLSNSSLDLSYVTYVFNQLEFNKDYVFGNFSGLINFKKMLLVVNVTADRLSQHEGNHIGSNSANEIIDIFNLNSNKCFVVERNGSLLFELNLVGEFTTLQVQGCSRSHVNSSDGSYAGIFVSQDNNNWTFAGKLPPITSSIKIFELPQKQTGKFIKLSYVNVPNQGSDSPDENRINNLGISYFKVITY